MSRTFTHSSTGTVVEYPNATHFAFVPAIFKITKIPTTYDKLEMVLTDRQAQQSYSEERERSRRKARNGLIAAFFVILATYAAVYIALGQETVRNIGLSDLYMRLMAALFIAVIAVFAFLPSSKYKRPDGEK